MMNAAANTKTITLSIPHTLPPDEAQARIQRTLASLQAQHAAKIAQVEEKWTGRHLDFRLGVMGQSLTGRVDVRDRAVDIGIDLPWLLAMFAEKFRGEVQREATKLLEGKPQPPTP
jgi:hypothetical protein